MRNTNWFGSTLAFPFGRTFVRRLSKDQQGTTAIEFGMVALPFFLFAFGIMLVAMKYFTENSLERAVETAARDVRTGQAQKAGKTLADFRQMVCDEAGTYISCDSKLVVHVQSGNEWSDITPTPCLTGGALTPSSGTGTDPLADSSGEAEAVVLVTACYEWDMTQAFNLGGLGDTMGDLSNGSALIQAVSTFRTEPYN